MLSSLKVICGSILTKMSRRGSLFGIFVFPTGLQLKKKRWAFLFFIFVTSMAEN